MANGANSTLSIELVRRNLLHRDRPREIGPGLAKALAFVGRLVGAWKRLAAEVAGGVRTGTCAAPSTGRGRCFATASTLAEIVALANGWPWGGKAQPYRARGVHSASAGARLSEFVVRDKIFRTGDGVSEGSGTSTLPRRRRAEEFLF